MAEAGESSVHAAALRHAAAVPDGAASAVRRLADDLLAGADDDDLAPGAGRGPVGYILVAIRYEERDLMREHREYAEYRRRVPMLIPRFGR